MSRIESNRKNFYVVTMYRWGCREKHSYVLGVFDDIFNAREHAYREVRDRGGKYEQEIIQVAIGEARPLNFLSFPVIESNLTKCSNCPRREAGHCDFFKPGNDSHCKSGNDLSDYEY